MSVEAYLFDICGVVWQAHESAQQLLGAIAKELNQSPKEVFSSYVKVYKDFELGKRQPQDLNLLPYEKITAILDSIYGEENFKKSINQDVINTISEIRASGRKVYCLSNLENFFGKYFRSQLDQYFDESFYSYEIHARKPDQEAFDHVLNRINLKPEQVVFIDDKKINTDAANKFGFKGILFSTSQDLNNQLKTVLP